MGIAPFAVNTASAAIRSGKLRGECVCVCVSLEGQRVFISN